MIIYAQTYYSHIVSAVKWYFWIWRKKMVKSCKNVTFTRELAVL